MKFYFLRTHFDSGRIRMVPLPEQIMDVISTKGTTVEEEINDAWNVQSDKEIRSAFPINTVFGTTELVKQAGFYKAGKVFPILPETEDYKNYDKPSQEMRDAYELYQSRVKTTFAKSTTKKATTSTAEPKSRPRRTFLSSIMSDKKLEPPTIEDGFCITPDKWYLLVRNVRRQIPIMIIGPTGTGKTELVRLLAERLEIPINIFDMGSMFDPISGLLGVHRLNKEGVSEFDYAKFPKAIQQEGIVLLDELSRAPITTNNILFPCLDSRKELPIEIAGGHDVRKVRVHDECSFIATANIGGEYTGTNQMDRALIDRFFPVELEYLTADQETHLLLARTTGLEKGDAIKVVTVAGHIRKLFISGEVSSTLSTRHTLLIASLIKDGFSLLSALQAVILPLFEGSDDEGERKVIKATLTTR